MSKGHNLFVAFDLSNPMQNYDRLGQAIVALGIPVKIGAQLWYVDSPIGAEEAETRLKAACDPGDTLMVIDASSNSAVSHNLRPMSGEMMRTLWNRVPPPAPAAPVAADGAAEAPVAPAGEQTPQVAWMNRLFAERTGTSG